MALVTVQRSPCGTTTANNCQCHPTDETDCSDNKEEDERKERKGISECYFAVKGAALVLPHDECLHVYRKPITNGVSLAASDIQQHLQAMLYLLHSEDILKMAVKLESIHNGRTRYLVVASHIGKQQMEESCLLGIDCNNQTTIGLVLPVWADTRITLDGDGGFSVTSIGRHHIFKPVSVQAMWSALQTLHKASSKARECNYFKGGGTHQWIEYYEKRITSDRSCLNEWHAMDDLESKRPPSPDTVRSRPTEREETEKHIRAKLKELMMSVDLDEVTSKYIRTRLEEILDMNLKEFKSFIDQEMLTILGQMDAPTEIFQYLYLGSEWNASNLEELVVNGIGHILNVTREIDNFFPGMFDYQNIRVYDEETTEILHYWDKTYRYIRKAKDEGSKVLVHCKMGISRSASVVIAYVMKAYDWNLQQALSFVKNKRNCIKPNSGFLKQLEIYQGILDASKHRHNSLWRSKSETNLKSSDKPKKKSKDKVDGLPMKSESLRHLQVPGTASRPKSWSPNDAIADMLFPPNGSISSEALSRGMFKSNGINDMKDIFLVNLNKPNYDFLSTKEECPEPAVNIDRLQPENVIPRVSSIKDRISELESQVSSTTTEIKMPRIEVKSPSAQSRGGLVLNLATQFESGSKPSSPVDEGLIMKPAMEEEIVEPVLSQMKPPAHKHHAVLVKPALWSDENSSKTCLTNASSTFSGEKDETSSKLYVNRIAGFHSAVSCDKKQTDKTLSAFDKTSHNIHDSAFKPVPAKSCMVSGEDKAVVSHLNACGGSSISPTSTKKSSESDFTVSNIQRNGKMFNKQLKGQSAPKSPCSLSQFKRQEFLSTPVSLSSPSTKETFESFDVPLKVNFIYDKEDIPFTPGTVQRTKQQLEEKSLTRTTSFDSGFPLHFGLMPSTQIDLDHSWGKPVRRSRSLRSEHRPTSMFSRKWYPLPALASMSPMPFKASDEKLSLENKLNTVHSVSTPSVVEAVNEVICGTKDVINSAIQYIPSDKNLVSTLCVDSDLDFGSVSSLPDIDVDVFTGNSSVCSESPVPGIVRQQCEKLESKNPKTLLQDKNETCKRKNETKMAEASSLVLSECISKEENEKDLGLVKRLTKELEAKSSTELLRKEKTSPTDSDTNRGKNQDKCLTPAFAPETRHMLACADIGLGPRKPTGLRSSLPSSVEKKLSCNTATPIAPPTPHRKTSLDLNFLRKSSRFPLTLKLHSQSKSESTKDVQVTSDDRSHGCLPMLKTTSVSRTTQHVDMRVLSESATDSYKASSRPPHAIKMNQICSPDIPPPPPLPSSIPRKTMRKQHGSTHPLSRLTIRQRHTNPLYNTM